MVPHRLIFKMQIVNGLLIFGYTISCLLIKNIHSDRFDDNANLANYLTCQYKRNMMTGGKRHVQLHISNDL